MTLFLLSIRREHEDLFVHKKREADDFTSHFIDSPRDGIFFSAFKCENEMEVMKSEWLQIAVPSKTIKS